MYHILIRYERRRRISNKTILVHCSVGVFSIFHKAHELTKKNQTRSIGWYGNVIEARLKTCSERIGTNLKNVKIKSKDLKWRMHGTLELPMIRTAENLGKSCLFFVSGGEGRRSMFNDTSNNRQGHYFRAYILIENLPVNGNVCDFQG